MNTCSRKVKSKRSTRAKVTDILKIGLEDHLYLYQHEPAQRPLPPTKPKQLCHQTLTREAPSFRPPPSTISVSTIPPVLIMTPRILPAHPLRQRIRPVATRAHKPNSNHHFSTPSIIISTSSSHRSILSVDFDVFCDSAICSCLSVLCRHIFSCAFEWLLGRAGVMVGS